MKLKMPAYDAELVEAVEDCLDMTFTTEIVARKVAQPPEDGLLTLYTRGYGNRTGRPNYQRPMFQIIPDGAFSGMTQPARRQCGACYDFSRTWNCPDHPDRGLERSVKNYGSTIPVPPAPVGVAAALRQAYENIVQMTEGGRGLEIHVEGRTADGARSFRYRTAERTWSDGW